MSDTVPHVDGFVSVRPSDSTHSPNKIVLRNTYQKNKQRSTNIVSDAASPDNNKKAKTSHCGKNPTRIMSMIAYLPNKMIPSNFLGTGPEFFMIRLKGNLELIYCDQGSNEGFLKGLMDTLFQVKPGNLAQEKIRDDLVAKTNILCVVPRRKSHSENVPQLKNADNGSAVKYKKMYFVRYPGIAINNNVTRLGVLQTLASFMTQYNQTHTHNPNGYYSVYHVPADYDQSPHLHLLTWDHYMLDEDILRIMGILYNPRPDQTFAHCENNDIHCHFSPPYSQLVCGTLGFSNSPENVH